MKTKTFHKSNLGSFSGGVVADSEGYVTYHASDRYSRATDQQLVEWAESGRTLAVRNAAQAEIAERKVEDWRNNG